MYHFVFETPQPSAAPSSAEDRRRAELQDSDARSHAAKMAYLKKLARQHVTQQQQQQQRRKQFRCVHSTGRDGNEDEDDNDEEGADNVAAVIRRNTINKRPDGSPPSPSPSPSPSSSAEHQDEQDDSSGSSNAELRPGGGRFSAPTIKSTRRQSCSCSYSYLSPGATKPKKGNRIYSRAKFRVEQPRSLLAQTSKDPFDAFPQRRLPENVEKVVQYAFDRIWPEMLCAVRGETLAIAKSEWKGHGLHDELLFHVQVALACGLNLALQTVPGVSEALALTRLSHYSTAIRLLKRRIESLEDGDGGASEDLMMSMLILGVNADVEPAMPEAHPPSPLATSQYMHLYGRLTLMPSYATALHQLVEARGGIFKLRHLALADWLLLADLHHASRTGDRLRYPPIRAYYSIVASAKHVLDAKAELLSHKLGLGFRVLDDALFTADLRDAVAKGVEATVALDHYHRYENRPPRLVDVMLAANEAQRTFLNVFPNRGVGLQQLVHEACRLGMLIFSDMVLFPMPSCTRIKPRLAAELRRVFETLESQGNPEVMHEARCACSSPRIADLILWALTLGGIAASFTDDRSWFEGRLRRRLRLRERERVREGGGNSDVDSDAGAEPEIEAWPLPPPSSSWPAFKDCVSTFLWWDPVVDEPARDLWEAAMRVAGADVDVPEAKNQET
ncbi:hypothetical protein CLCR_00372 [Cladophialophora carrionii]|uniref:Uncharacterized protein n=1 Tax=Cladophialophora carrionii TaxID=86049 RepID=A0A1C1CBP8_9EURO|nr:hypothetical protein CLCR_00372 [Cladophialophora carrionii]